jgi:hypothetical protein
MFNKSPTCFDQYRCHEVNVCGSEDVNAETCVALYLKIIHSHKKIKYGHTVCIKCTNLCVCAHVCVCVHVYPYYTMMHSVCSLSLHDLCHFGDLGIINVTTVSPSVTKSVRTY